MLNGEFPKECSACSSMRYNTESPNSYANDLFAQEINSRVQLTDKDGSLNIDPSYFDYRFSNICDLKCKMCNQESSSRHEQQQREQDNIQGPTINQQRADFSKKILLPEMKNSIDNGSLTHLYWAGGEPLLMDEHWEIIQYAVDKNRAQEINLYYNTNLNQWHLVEERFIKLASQFRSVSLDFSIDGVEQIGSYIREGLNWERFEKNVSRIEKLSMFHLAFAITLTIPGALYLDGLLNFLSKHKLKYHLCLAAPIGPTDLFSFAVLPPEIKMDLINRLNKLLRLYPEKYFDPFTEAIKLIEQTKYMAESSETLKKQIIHNAKLLHGQEKKSKLPTLSELYHKRSKIIGDWWDSLLTAAL